MGQGKARRGGITDIIRSPYARGFISRYKWNYIIGMAILVAIDLAQTEVPIIVGSVIDGIEAGGIVRADLVGAVLRMALIASTVLVGRIAWRYFIFGAARKIERDLRNDLFSHLNTLPSSYFHEHKAGEIMAYMTSDIDAIRMTFAMTIMMGMDALAIGLATVIKMIVEIDFRLSITTVVPMSLVILVSTFVGREMHRRFTRRQEAFARVADFVQEKLSGMKVIKAFVQEEKECASFGRVNAESREANIREARVQAFLRPFMQMIAGCSMALAIAYGGYIAIMGEISVGDFAAFIQYLNMLVMPMAAVGRIINIVTRGSASLKRIETVLHTESDIPDFIPEGGEEEKLTGDIRVEGLTFRYPGTDRDVLRDVSFTVPRGGVLGVVGRTGAGKTTLADVLLRVEDPGENMIFIGGKEIHSVSLKTLRSAAGYVMQDNFLFSDTVRNNISFGDRSLGMDKIVAAAKAACVHDDIMGFTDGYDTVVGERGVSLSGGQKQRIAIARALILDPEILILDDSVSAVDTDTEERILSNLAAMRRGRTNIVIAHRISTLQHADMIIVIDGGTVAERGTHDELVAMGGIYADLHRRQLLEKMKKEEYVL